MTMEQRQGSTHVDLDLDQHTPQEILRVQRLAREIRLTDQILSVDLDVVDVVLNGPAPAWTTLTGEKITFAYNRMPKPVNAHDVAVWIGTNAHELGHNLYSPRKGSTLMFRVLESDRTFLPGIKRLCNIVEDQRQERLILGRFSPWRGYLTAALGYHLVSDDPSAWLLMTGRTWLPQPVRDAAKLLMQATRGNTITDETTRLVGEYQRLTDPGESEADEAWAILQELHKLFGDDMPSGGGCGGGVLEDGEPDTEGAESDAENAPATADEADDADGEGEGDEGSAEGKTDSPDTGTDGESGDSAGNETSDKDDEGQTSSSEGAGAGTQPRSNTPKPQPDKQKSWKEQIRDASKDQIADDPEAKEDLDSILDAIEHGRGGDRAEGDRAMGHTTEATDVARRLHREVAQALLQLKDEREPGWIKRVDSGRLNARQYMLTDDIDAWFDRYEPGQLDSTELEVVLLVDVSSSMSPLTQEVGEATWAIRRAVDDMEGTCTVFVFDSGPHRILAEGHQRPDERMFIPDAQGGTNPTSALTETFRVIAGSQTRNRLVVILTDGEWSGRTSDDIIAALNAQGVITVLARLSDEWTKQYMVRHGETASNHGCTHVADIDDPAELARLFKRVAAERIKAQW